jgi:hypothetical protein
VIYGVNSSSSSSSSSSDDEDDIDARFSKKNFKTDE